MSEQVHPILMAVDNDPVSLEALRRQLSEKYAGRFQIETVSMPDDAVKAMHMLKLRDARLALLLANCDLGESSGMDLLRRAGELFPRAKRVLVADYDDRPTVAQAMRQLALDHYVLKPFRHPEDELFPVLDDLLKDWEAIALDEEHGGAAVLRIVGHRWSPNSHRIREFLARNLIPYRWIEYEQPEGRAMVDAAGLNHRRLPVVFFPDGTQLSQPTIKKLAGRVGLQQKAEARFYDLVVIGGGPAGLSAAVYGASEGLHTLLIEAEAPGGQAGASSRIDNYLGFPSGLSGSELTRRAVAQAQRFQVEILTPQQATGIRLRGNYRLVTLANGTEVACHVLLIATGVSYMRLNVPNVDRLTGAGIYYGAVITEAITCQGKEVFVLGGGNSAGQAAMYLSRYARSITIVTNTDTLAETMSHYLIEQIHETKNIRVRTRSTISAVEGKDRLEKLTVRDEKTGSEEEHEAAALFIYIGAKPRTDWVGDLLARDEQGYLLTGPDVEKAGQDERFRALGRSPYFLESSVPGIFVAGDTRSGSVKRIASSVGEGAMAVTFIHRYLAGL